MKCIQHILLAYNALFTLTGIILISVGSSVNSIYEEYAEFLESRLFSPSLMIIAVGIVMFGIAIFGVYGAIKLSVAAIMIYSMLLLGVFIIEMTAGLIGYILEDEIEDILNDTLNQTMTLYPTDNIAAAAIDSLQNNLMCCGINGPMDWVKITSLENDTVLRLPDSCCAIYEHDKCIALKGVGCLNQLEYLISQCGFLFSGTVLTIAVIQLLGVTLSCKLARQLRRQKTLRDRIKWEVRENITNSYHNFKLPNGNLFVEEKPNDKLDYVIYNKV